VLVDIKGNGYIRVCPVGSVWGSSFVLPGYWENKGLVKNPDGTTTESSVYHNNPLIKSGQFSYDPNDRSLVFTGVMGDVSGNWQSNFTIRFNGDDTNPELHIQGQIIALKPFNITTTGEEGQAFKYVQVSVMDAWR